MRPIKFRAWWEGKMYYNSYLKERYEKSKKERPGALGYVNALFITLEDGLRFWL